MRIGAASVRDAAGIVRLFRESFPEELLELSIYGCRGVRRYVEMQIAVPHASSDRVYVAAREGGRLLGAVEARRFRETVFINYIAVAAQARDRGIGSKLLRAAAERLRTSGTAAMSLDVLETNSGARRWYRRLGFREMGRTNFAIFEGGREERADFSIAGYPQALTAYREFGFAEFRLQTARGEYDVGMLGRNYYRVKADALRAEPALPSLLRRLDPRRRILCLRSDGPRGVLRLLRLTAPLGDFVCSES